ncbi:MAG: nucleoside phosphorylase [Magnetovibrio sp.]|nr:nucleoside phosphorylase [Magnetovibrio sp.]
MKTGVVSGLPRETECFAAIPEVERDFATFAGIGPERAAEGARELVARGAEALMSFGVAGGLADPAHAGTIVLADRVIDGDTAFETAGDWRRLIRDRIGDAFAVVDAPLAGTARMVPTPAAKARMHEETGAVACDMESHAVARVAAEAGVPFCVVRAISDPAHRHVPKWVLGCITPRGDVRTGKLAGRAAVRPWAWLNLVGLARDSGRAFDALRHAAAVLGPRLGR